MTQRRSRKLGTIAERAKGKRLTEVAGLQFALEQAMKRIGALEKQADGLALLDKQREIQANKDRLRIKDIERDLGFARSAIRTLEITVNRSECG
jgi:hypothetical protein